MSATVFEIPDPNATLLEITRDAHARGLHVIHNGHEIVVSPIVPPGWWRVAINIKPSKPQPVSTRLWDEGRAA